MSVMLLGVSRSNEEKRCKTSKLRQLCYDYKRSHYSALVDVPTYVLLKA